MTSSPHGPYEQGFTRHTMVGTEGSESARISKPQKAYRSPDCTLQLECMKSESLVIADQHAAVNTFPGLVHTARHTMGVEDTRSSQANCKEADYHGMFHDWGEVVTRQQQGNLRLDHLLSREKDISQVFTFIDCYIAGDQLNWQSACFASRRSSVRSRHPPPILWVCSSVGQSTRLISVGSLVRVQPDPPYLKIPNSLYGVC